ncbi:MAG: DUF4293 domain-containing protein [Bacteroidota bacterium]
MIQRVQSIFLLLTAIIMIAVVFLPLWQKTSTDGSEYITLSALELIYMDKGEISLQKDTFYVALLAGLAALVAVYSIFQFKNRLRQMQLGALNSLLMGGALGLTYYYTTKANALLEPSIQGEFLTGFYIIAAALFFNVLANRFIRRDEKLVRSADRIR